MSKLVHFLSEILDLPEGKLVKMLEAMVNCGRLMVVIVVVSFSEPRLTISEKMLLISALELLATLVGYVICSKNIYKKRKSRNSIAGG